MVVVGGRPWPTTRPARDDPESARMVRTFTVEPGLGDQCLGGGLCEPDEIGNDRSGRRSATTVTEIG